MCPAYLFPHFPAGGSAGIRSLSSMANAVALESPCSWCFSHRAPVFPFTHCPILCSHPSLSQVIATALKAPPSLLRVHWHPVPETHETPYTPTSGHAEHTYRPVCSRAGPHYTHTHTCTYRETYTYTLHIHTCMPIHLWIYIEHIHMHTYTHTHAGTQHVPIRMIYTIHTHIHAHTLR